MWRWPIRLLSLSSICDVIGFLRMESKTIGNETKPKTPLVKELCTELLHTHQ